MYKNLITLFGGLYDDDVSILVLMDLCIKTVQDAYRLQVKLWVSILVLMDLCIKTLL